MRAKVKHTRRKASQLHGATAGYVSLVDRGANETPFKMIKSAEGAGAMSIKKRTTTTKSHKKLAVGQKTEDAPVTKTIMAKMVFDQNEFEDEASVQEWLEKAEWDAESVVITDDGDGSFVARPADTTDDSFTRMAKVDAETAGVEAYVGELIVKDDEEDEDDADEEDEEEEVTAMDGKKKKPYVKGVETKAEDKPATPVVVSKRAAFIAKAKSSVVKFDSWDAYYSKKSTLQEALLAGMQWDKTPPGFYDVQSAFNGVVQSILGDDAETSKAEMLGKAAADYAEILIGMDSFFDAYLAAGEETVSKAFEGADTAEKLAKWADGYAQFVAGGDAPKVETKTAVKKAAEAAAIDYTQIGTTVAELVQKALAPITERVESIGGTVQKMADRRPTKKAVDATDAPPVLSKEQKTEEATADWLRGKQKKALVG